MVSRDILGEMCEGDRVLNGISKKFDYIFLIDWIAAKTMPQ